MSRYHRPPPQDEMDSVPFRTRPIAEAGVARIDALAHVVASIASVFLNDRWWCTWNRGSVTFKHRPAPSQPITVFIDLKNKLAEQYHLSILSDPIVIAADLTSLSPFHRHSVRQELRALFADFYMDPENYWLDPVKKHFNPRPPHHFDIMFVRDSTCPADLAPDAGVLEAVRGSISKKISGCPVPPSQCRGDMQ